MRQRCTTQAYIRGAKLLDVPMPTNHGTNAPRITKSKDDQLKCRCGAHSTSDKQGGPVFAPIAHLASQLKVSTRQQRPGLSHTLPRQPHNVLLVLHAVHEARRQLPLAQRVPRLDLGLVVDVHGPDRAGVRLRLPRALEPGAAGPVDVLLELVHAVEGVEHIVQNATREEDVVEALLPLIRHGELQNPEAALQDAEEALHVLPHALQPLRKQQVAFAQWVLGGLNERHPLHEKKKKTGAERVGKDTGYFGRSSFCSRTYTKDKSLARLKRGVFLLCPPRKPHVLGLTLFGHVQNTQKMANNAQGLPHAEQRVISLNYICIRIFSCSPNHHQDACTTNRHSIQQPKQVRRVHHR